MASDSCIPLTSAIDLLLNNEFKSGEEQLQASLGASPRHALLYAQLAFARSVLSMVPSDLEDALARCWAADAAMEAQLAAEGGGGGGGMLGRMSSLLGGGGGGQGEGEEEGAKLRREMEGKLVKADAHLMGAVMQLLLGRYLKGAWNLRAGWNLYHAAKKIQDDRPSDITPELNCLVDFGIGMLNLVLSLLPGSYLALAQLAGFHGQRHTALSLLSRSYQSSEFWAPFAALLLLYFYTQLVPNVGLSSPSDGAAVDLILAAPVATKYKGSALFLWMQGGAFRIAGKDTEAIAVLKEAEEKAAEMMALQGIIRNDLAWGRMRAGDWGGAAHEYGRLLQGYALAQGGGGPYNGVYAYEAGVCLLAQGEEEAGRALLEAADSYAELDDPAQGTTGRGEWGPVRYALDMAAALLSLPAPLHKQAGEIACIELLVLWDFASSLPPAAASSFLSLLPDDPALASPVRRKLLGGALRLALSPEEKTRGEKELWEVIAAPEEELTTAMPAAHDGRHYKAFAMYLLGRAKVTSGEEEAVKEGQGLLAGASAVTECQLAAFLAFKLHANAP